MMTQEGIEVDFTDELEPLLFAEASIGIKASEFLETEVGRLLKGYAIQEIQECAIALLSVKYTDEEQIAQLQIRAKAAQNFIAWVNEAINRGNSAHYELMQRRGN